jgi:hypothetical protein
MTHAHSPKRPAAVPLYKRDLYAWVEEQVRLLTARRLDEIDSDNIAEELLDVGSNEYDKLESALRVLLTHILKWDHQPEKRSRSWANTIEIQRHHALRQLRKSPSLRSRIEEATVEAYFDARRLASSETEFDLGRFPEACPYDWHAIMKREFRP